MPVSFSVKNVPDRVAKALRARAARNHRSLQGELLAILAAAAAPAAACAEAVQVTPAAVEPGNAHADVRSGAPYVASSGSAGQVRETAEPWGAELPPRTGGGFGSLLPSPAVHIPTDRLEALCRRWKVRELSLFGSAIRDDFRPDSDVDLLVDFQPNAPCSLFDLMDLQDELADLFGRRVDLVEKSAVEQSPNWIRRRHILRHHQVIYAS